jgi:hypothetical protein
VFHEMGKDNVEKHWFTCKSIWYVKRIIDEVAKIVQLETTFKDRSLTWYMKYKSIAPVGQLRSMENIKHDMLREFQKPKSKSHCIKEIK